MTLTLSHYLVLAAALHSLQAHQPCPCRVGLIAQHDTAAFRGGDVLVGVEAERNEIADRPDTLPFPDAAQSLRGILDDAQAVAPRDVV